MDLIRVSERYVYLRVKLPRERYESLLRVFGTEGRALQHLRLRWMRVSEAGPIDSAAESSAAGLGRVL